MFRLHLQLPGEPHGNKDRSGGGGAGLTDKKLTSYGSRIFLREPEILFHSVCPFRDDPQVSLC